MLHAHALVALGRGDEALADANRLLADNPSDLSGLLISGIAAGDSFSQSHSAALRRLEEALPEETLRTADVYCLRALATIDAEEAIELLDRALDLSPGHAHALRSRTERLLHLKRFPEALQTS